MRIRVLNIEYPNSSKVEKITQYWNEPFECWMKLVEVTCKQNEVNDINNNSNIYGNTNIGAWHEEGELI